MGSQVENQQNQLTVVPVVTHTAQTQAPTAANMMQQTEASLNGTTDIKRK